MKKKPLLNKFEVSLNSIHNAIWNNLCKVIYNRHYKSSFGSFDSSSPISIQFHYISKQSLLLKSQYNISEPVFFSSAVT